MKIKSIVPKGKMMHVLTNNSKREEFVYFKDKFNSIESLENEIRKSISLEEKIEKIKKEKFDKILKELK